MFILSVMTKKLPKKFVCITAVFLIAAVIITSVVLFINLRNPKIIYDGKSISTIAKNNSDIKLFANELGWEISEQPKRNQNIVIPVQFNDTYLNYNALQKKIGFDLEKFAGKECKLYSFQVKNYPHNNKVTMNIIVYQEHIIGGDISEDIYNGFIYGLGES